MCFKENFQIYRELNAFRDVMKMGIISGPSVVPVRGRPSGAFREKLKDPKNEIQEKVPEKDPKEFNNEGIELITSRNIMIHKFKCISGDKDFMPGRNGINVLDSIKGYISHDIGTQKKFSAQSKVNRTRTSI